MTANDIGPVVVKRRLQVLQENSQVKNRHVATTVAESFLLTTVLMNQGIAFTVIAVSPNIELISMVMTFKAPFMKLELPMMSLWF